MGGEEGAAGVEDVRRGFEGEDGVGEGAGFVEVQGADDVFEGGDGVGGGAEFADAEADQQGGEFGVPGHFAADAGGDVVGLGGGGRQADETEDGRVGKGTEVGDAFVAAVGGQGVLAEVVGADAEEGGVRGDPCGGEGGGGDFDHDADGDVGAVGDAFGCEFGGASHADGFGGAEVGEVVDHGVHDAEVSAFGCGAEEGAELGLEEFGTGEAEAQGAATHGGVVFGGEVEVAGEFVAAEVEGADGYGGGGEGAGDGEVGMVLAVFVGKGGAVHEEVFAAEKADAVGTGGQDAGGIIGGFDVGAQGDGGTVEGDGGEVAEFGKAGAEAVSGPDAFGGGGLAVGGGAEDEESCGAVEEYGTGGGRGRAPVGNPDEGGDAEGAGEDGGVGGGAAFGGGECEEASAGGGGEVGGG